MEEVLSPIGPETPLQSLSDAERYLESLINLERDTSSVRRRVSLEPIEKLLLRIGSPQQSLRVLHIAGSKGKGSTALLAESLLSEAGRQVGTFTSPHLVTWTERFRVSGKEVYPGDLTAVVADLRSDIDALRQGSDRQAPTFFDATTAVAFELFRRACVDIGVIEVGLGGRLDSTNVVLPEVTCVTSIELEHTEKLGTTLAMIAREKAGIVKRGVPVVVGPLEAEAEKVVIGKAQQCAAPIFRFGRDFGVDLISANADGMKLRLWDGEFACAAEIPVLGRHQAVNAALAWMCARRLEPDVDWWTLTGRALAKVTLPGRIEIVGRNPWMIVDAAHTAASAHALANVLAALDFDELHLVLSVSEGKDIQALCRALVSRANQVIVTRAEPLRSLPEAIVASAVRDVSQDCLIQLIPDPHVAVQVAKGSLSDNALVCATGSTYLAGIARQSWLSRDGPASNT